MHMFKSSNSDKFTYFLISEESIFSDKNYANRCLSNINTLFLICHNKQDNISRNIPNVNVITTNETSIEKLFNLIENHCKSNKRNIYILIDKNKIDESISTNLYNKLISTDHNAYFLSDSSEDNLHQNDAITIEPEDDEITLFDDVQNFNNN